MDTITKVDQNPVQNINRYYLKLLAYVVVVALLAFAAFSFLNKSEDATVTTTTITDPSAVVKTSFKEVRGFDMTLAPEKRLAIIMGRVNSGTPLTYHEKQVILEQFTIGTQIKLSDSERQKINQALNK